MQTKGAPRRRHSDELKAQVLAACALPGASVAAVAQSHGLNANLVHKWRRGPALAPQPAVAAAASVAAVRATITTDPGLVGFVPLQLPARTPAAPAADIRIELRRGATSVTVTWPTHAAAECASWMRELLQ
ncbi:IS66-like element accessory protein TnpA [Roseateles sp.]|uniref:IS66-like element accessory protein TnpA n=1 Tax=Roseateles sp. TaxID=1971397 RepID=UPI003265A9A9